MDEAKLAELIGNAVAPLKTLVESQATTIAQMQSQLTVNADAVDQANRDVILAKAPALKLTVNALKGDALAELAASYQTAASIKSGELETNADNSGAGQFDTYKGV